MAISHCYCYSSYRQINWQIYPLQLSTDALSTITPTLADLLADLPLAIEHICLEYCYTKLGRSTGRSPPTIKHRCLQYHYTKLGRSTPWQASIDALKTVTPNMADLPPQLSIDSLSTVTPNMADLLPTPQSSTDALSTITLHMADLHPWQSSIAVLKTITPNMADLTPPT